MPCLGNMDILLYMSQLWIKVLPREGFILKSNCLKQLLLYFP